MTSSKLCFLAQFIFSLEDNDTDISKTHLNKAEQIINVDFYLRLQNTENFGLSAPSKEKNEEKNERFHVKQSFMI